MQNDRTALIAGKDIKTHKLEMRQHKKKKLMSDLNKQKKYEKNEEATVVMLANSSDDQLSSQSCAPEDADDCDEKAFCFWCGQILF